jgi:UDP-hydrolysing UDP-N-acetyl-D-glucosamine 2-epimerase
MRRVCVVITARPSYSRVKTVLDSVSRSEDLELVLIVTASALLDRYGNVSYEIEKEGFRIDSKVYTVLEGESPSAMAKTTGIAIIELTTELQRLKPDVVLTIADRYETIATAISATYLGIPLIHLQGGEVTGSIDERVRHAITKLADIHLACTRQAANNIIRMGENPESVFVTGCPSIDIASHIQKESTRDLDLFRIYKGVGNKLDLSQTFIVAMLHPVTNEFLEAESQAALLLQVLKEEHKQVLWFWPNVDAGSDGTSRALRCFREENHLEHFFFIKNVSPSHFLELLMMASCIIGNSSVALRECAYLGIPAINIGSRQQFRERGPNVIDCSWEYNSIKNALSLIGDSRLRVSSNLYGEGQSGERIAKILSEIDLDRFRQKALYIQTD